MPGHRKLPGGWGSPWQQISTLPGCKNGQKTGHLPLPDLHCRLPDSLDFLLQYPLKWETMEGINPYSKCDSFQSELLSYYQTIRCNLSDSKYQSPPLVVHFDRLKLCSPNVRQNKERLMSGQDTPKQSHHDPPGAHVELLDDTKDVPNLPVPPSHRYPSHERRPPDYFANFATHWIWDVFFIGEELCVRTLVLTM